MVAHALAEARLADVLPEGGDGDDEDGGGEGERGEQAQEGRREQEREGGVSLLDARPRKLLESVGSGRIAQSADSETDEEDEDENENDESEAAREEASEEEAAYEIGSDKWVAEQLRLTAALNPTNF